MPQTQSTSYFTGLRDDLTGLAIDLVRARHIDTELITDNETLADEASLRAGFGARETFSSAPGGIPITTWLFVGAAIVGGVIVFKKFV